MLSVAELPLRYTRAGKQTVRLCYCLSFMS
jgi:hypothetical protein